VQNKSGWVSDTDTAKKLQIDAHLAVIHRPHAYFWVENDVNFDMTEGQKAGGCFFRDKIISPPTAKFFGRSGTPGVDQRCAYYLVYAAGLAVP